MRSMKRGARVYTCVCDRMRDTRQGHIKEEIEGAWYVVGRHRWRGLSIGVCRKGVVETLGD